MADSLIKLDLRAFNTPDSKLYYRTNKTRHG